MAGFSQRLLAAVTGRRVVPSVPPGRVVHIEGTEEAAQSERRDGVSSLGLFIEYRDAKGVITARRIACRSYDRSTDCITAFCFERRAARAFRVDRIITACCTETGEVFEIEKIAASLRSRDLPASSTPLKVILRILVFLMRCDGVDHREVEALEAAIVGFAMRFDGDDAMIEEGMRLAQTLAPDEGDFFRALRWIRLRKDGPQLARFLRGHAQRIVDADGVHSDEEFRLAREVDLFLGVLAARAG